MDWITHSAAGASIAWAWPRRWAVPKAAPIAVAAALLSDLDYFIEPFLDPRSDFAHRGFTHSPFGVVVLAPVIALVPLWLSKEKRSSARYARLVALIAAGILSHVVLDLLTELGGKVVGSTIAQPIIKRMGLFTDSEITSRYAVSLLRSGGTL